MRRFVFIGFVWIVVALNVHAQEPFVLPDTIHMEEVVTYGKLRKFQSGAKIEMLSAEQFQSNQDGNLEQMLSRTLPIAFKSNAGSLSTIRLRGTSPNHTSINFGGINLNSLTLGQSNGSSIPMYLFDHVGVQFGSASTVNGSGSIGGAIHLGLDNHWTDGFKAETRLSSGSFGEQLIGTKLFMGNGSWEAVTRAYYYSKTNDFPFYNPNYKDHETGIVGKEDRQRNANIENKGLLQELNYRFAENEVFTFNIWLENDWHLIQQSMKDVLKKEDHEENNVRIWTGYQNRKGALKYEVGGGYVFDQAVDSIQTQRAVGELVVEHDVSAAISYKMGLKAMRIVPKVHAYEETLEYEDRLDVYASYYHRLFNKLTVTLNLRQGFVTHFEVPFTPSLGLNYLAFSKEKYVLSLGGNVARSYRVPTFNDRFWVPGGNPNLRPEKGWSYELTGKLSYCTGKTSGNLKMNGFYMDIDDWILWKNGGAYWYAENVQRVKSMGFELMTDWKYRLWGLETTSGLNYTFTHSKRVEALTPTNALNRQLEYVPFHAGTLFTSSRYQKLALTIDASYTGRQYTDEEDKNILDDYFLLNSVLGYSILNNKDHQLKMTGTLANVLNVNYQSSWGYAMPRRNYRLSLIYHFK
jgi:iron complex outermembrane receptor protein